MTFAAALPALFAKGVFCHVSVLKTKKLAEANEQDYSPFLLQKMIQIKILLSCLLCIISRNPFRVICFVFFAVFICQKT